MTALTAIGGCALLVAGGATMLACTGYDRWAAQRLGREARESRLLPRCGFVLFCLGMALAIEPLVAKVLWAACGAAVAFVTIRERHWHE